MNATELARLVQHMRTAQKEYFLSRDQWQLSESKRLEKRCDEAVAEILDGQGRLFDSAPESAQASADAAKGE